MTLMPDLVLPARPQGVATRGIAERPASRDLAVTRAADAARPSTQALLAAVRDAVQEL